MEKQNQEPKPAPDPDRPLSEDHMNRPGMTNGVPDEAHQDEALALPHDERHEAEKAATEHTAKP